MSYVNTEERIIHVKGFDIQVNFWENHFNVTFPLRILKKNEKGNVMQLNMEDVCDSFSKHFYIEQTAEGKTRLKYSRNNVPEDKTHADIFVALRSPRKVSVRIGEHEVRASILLSGSHNLLVTLPDNINGDFTFAGLMRAIKAEFIFNPNRKMTNIVCLDSNSEK